MKHGKTHTRLYNIWSGMKQRCFNPNNPKYRSYGGKGISVCDEWKNSFDAFGRWAHENGYEDPPKDCDWWFMSYHALTLDRIDEHKGYEPKNCRWIPFQENRLHRTCGQKH